MPWLCVINMSSGLLTTTNISYIFIHVIIFKTLPFLIVFIVLDIVMRSRSFYRRRTKSIVVIVIAMVIIIVLLVLLLLVHDWWRPFDLFHSKRKWCGKRRPLYNYLYMGKPIFISIACDLHCCLVLQLMRHQSASSSNRKMQQLLKVNCMWWSVVSRIALEKSSGWGMDSVLDPGSSLTVFHAIEYNTMLNEVKNKVLLHTFNN